jgi:autotransporter-associated beta strand protein
MKSKIFNPFLFALFAASSLHAANLTWDLSTAAGIQDGDGTWTPATSTFSPDGVATAVPARGTDAIIFGVAVPTGTNPLTPTNTVTISNGGAYLNYANNNSASSLTINRNYTFNAAAAGDGLAVGNMTINNGAVVTFNAGINGGLYDPTLPDALPSPPAMAPGTSVTGKNWAINNGSTLNLAGGGRIQAFTTNSATEAFLNLTAGTYTAGALAGSSANPGADGFINFGGGAGGTRILTVNQAAGVIVNDGGGNYNVGGQSSNSADTRTNYNLNGGTLTAGNFSMGAGVAGTAGAASQAIFNLNTGSVTASGEVRAGNDGGSGILNVKGGTLTGGNMVIARRGNAGGSAITGAVNISGGVTKVAGVLFGANQATPNFAVGSTGTLNVTGGSLYLSTSGIGLNGGATGLANPNLTTAVNLSGGIIGATDNWTAVLPVNLSNANGGITFQAANDTAVSKNITLTGGVTGDGTLRKSGAGTLTLNSTTANSFSGGTLITSGTLLAATAGSMGLGNINLVSGAFTSQSASAIADTAILLFAASATPTITLTYAGSDTVAGVSNGTTNLTPGTYTTAQLNSFFGGGAFTGTGSLTIIPEPASSALLGLGLVSFGLVRRRKAV